MVDLVRAAVTAKRLIEKHGRAVTLYRSNRTPDNPAQPWRGTSTDPATLTGGIEIAAVKVAFVPATGGGFGKMAQDVNGELNVIFDQVGLLATNSLPTGVTGDDVEECDLLLDASLAGEDRLWKIVTRGHLRPAGGSIMFVLGLKR